MTTCLVTSGCLETWEVPMLALVISCLGYPNLRNLKFMDVPSPGSLLSISFRRTRSFLTLLSPSCPNPFERNKHYLCLFDGCRILGELFL